MPTFYQHTQIGYKYLSAMIYIFFRQNHINGATKYSNKPRERQQRYQEGV